jgi:integrase
MATLSPFPSTGNPSPLLPFFALEPQRTPQHTVPSVATLLQTYERTYLPQLALSTQTHHRVVFRWLCRHYGDLPLTAITPAWLRQWQEAITPGHTVGTVRQYLVTMSGALRWAVEQGWLDANPMDQVRIPPQSPGRVRFLSAEESQRLIDACQRSDNAFLYVIVMMAVSTGCRRQELCRLRWPEVDLERGTVRLVTTKNKHPRAVPVTGLALELLRAHATTARSGVAWVFPRVDGQRPVLIEQAWRTARKRAGLLNFRFHDLRHTCASYLAMTGASLLDIAEVLGHKKLDMVKRYTHLTEPHTRGVLARMVEQHLGAAPKQEEPRR